MLFIIYTKSSHQFDCYKMSSSSYCGPDMDKVGKLVNFGCFNCGCCKIGCCWFCIDVLLVLLIVELVGVCAVVAVVVIVVVDVVNGVMISFCDRSPLWHSTSNSMVSWSARCSLCSQSRFSEKRRYKFKSK